MLKVLAIKTMLPLLLCGLIVSVFNVQPVKAAAQVDVLSHSGWIDSLGSYHVSGEVKNIGDNATGPVRITATFYDSSNTVVAVSSGYTYLRLLLPGRRSPFEVLLTDETQAAKVHHYSLSITFPGASPIPTGLEILSDSSYIDHVGFMHVVGEIKNIANGTATDVIVAATFYNTTGHVVATAFTYSDPSDLSPGQTAPFEVLLVATNRVPLVASYELTADSTQYALVPEFSLTMHSTFILTALIAITLLKQDKKKNNH
jgi:hypothetical protein